MKNLKRLSLLALTVVLVISSCRKDDDDTTVVEPSQLEADVALIKTFMNNNRKAAEHFIVDAAAGGFFTTEDGSLFQVLPNSFTTQSGASVTGDIDIAVQEFNQVSEMIFADKPTVTDDGKILISAGEFFITATNNGNELVAETDAISVSILRDTTQGNLAEMSLWGGDTSSYTTYAGYDYQNVHQFLAEPLVINPGVLWSRVGFVSVTPNTYEMVFDSINNWTNCDALYSDPRPKTTLLCYMDHFNDSTVNVGYSIQPSMLYFKPSTFNSVIKLYNVILDPPAGYEGFLSYQNAMPIGLSGDFLAVTSEGGKLYAELKTATIPSPDAGNDYSTMNFNLTEVTEAQLKNMILSLD